MERDEGNIDSQIFPRHLGRLDIPLRDISLEEYITMGALTDRSAHTIEAQEQLTDE